MWLTKRFIKDIGLNDDYIAFIESLTDQEINILMEYTGDEYYNINQSLRIDQPSDQAKILINLFSRAPRLKKDLTLFRSVDYDDEYPEPDDGNYRFKGFVSTTYDPELKGAPLSQESTILVIAVPIGTHVIPWNEMSEQEIILPHDTYGVIESVEPYYHPYLGEMSSKSVELINSF